VRGEVSTEGAWVGNTKLLVPNLRMVSIVSHFLYEKAVDLLIYER
jgi:hypothetical protein